MGEVGFVRAYESEACQREARRILLDRNQRRWTRKWYERDACTIQLLLCLFFEVIYKPRVGKMKIIIYLPKN